MATWNESIAHTSPHHYKFGMLHCDVKREGFLAVASDNADITDSGEVRFESSNITVRHKEDKYTFTHND